MKATTKVMAVLWALVLAGLWLPQVTLAGVCQISEECCEVDADCDEGDTCLDTFGACETTGSLCDEDLDCGGKCSIRTNRDCPDPGCGKVCSVAPHYICVQDENCAGAENLCVQETCDPVEECVQDPAATGRCEEIGGGGAETPCTAGGDCTGDEYCASPGGCTTDGAPCQVGVPRGTCSENAAIPCETDYPCAQCAGTSDWCDNDSDCKACSETGQACFTAGDCLAVCDSGPNENLYCFVDTDCPKEVSTCGPVLCVGGFCAGSHWDGEPCTGDGQCNAAPATNICDGGPHDGAACTADSECMNFPDPICNTTQTCDGSSCDKTPICLLPHSPVGACDGDGADCQNDGDCDGGEECVFEGSCTAGKCSNGGLPCAVDGDCGLECGGSGSDCAVDADCGLACGGLGGSPACEVDADCGRTCVDSGYTCTDDGDCRTTCFRTDDEVVTDTGWPCPNTGYCETVGVGDPAAPPCDGADACECKLYKETEVCTFTALCEPAEECLPEATCNINDGCTTDEKLRCSNNKNRTCVPGDTRCAGCALRGESCASDSDCPKQCSLSGDTCTDSCPKVCSDDPTVECVNQADCVAPGLGTCDSQTCDLNECLGSCEPVFYCEEVATGKCTGTKCTRESDCALLTPATEDDYTCTGDFDCCTGTCGVLADVPDPQCGAGDCETCMTGEPEPTCTDADSDGYAVEGGVCGDVDCDDSNPAVNPAGVENGAVDPATCADTLDNDCNDLTDTADPKCQAPPGTCAASASASTGDTGTGGGHSGWYLFLLAGVILIGAGANRVFGNRKE